MSVERWMLLAIVWITDFSVFMVVFAVGRGLAESGADSVILGLAGGGFSVAMGLSCLIGGRLSDRVGRIRVILAGTLGIPIATWGLMVLEADSCFYIPMYMLIAAVTGLIYPPTVAWLQRGRDATTDRGAVSRMIIIYCIAWNGGLISAQLTGGWLYHLDPLRPIQAALLLGLINPLLLWVVARRRTSLSASPSLDTTAHLEHRAASAAFSRLAWMANLGGAFAMSMVFHLFPLLMVELQIPSREHGGLLAMNRVVVVITYLFMHRLQFWHHRFSTTALSQILAVAGLLVLASAHSRLGVIVGLVSLAQLMGYNYFASLYYSTTGVTEERRGAASGMHEFTLSVGFAAGAAGGGMFGQVFGIRAPYQLAAAFILALLILQLASLAAFKRKQLATKT